MSDGQSADRAEAGLVKMLTLFGFIDKHLLLQVAVEPCVQQRETETRNLQRQTAIF